MIIRNLLSRWRRLPQDLGRTEVQRGAGVGGSGSPLSAAQRELVAGAAYLAAPVFQAAGWEWEGSDGRAVPSESAIAALLINLTERASKIGEGSSGSGRFRVHRWIEDGWEQYAVTLELGDLALPAPQPQPESGSEEGRLARHVERASSEVRGSRLYSHSPEEGEPDGNVCITCGEGIGDEQRCPESKRPCGHHCNCSWINDRCHWCGREFGEEGEREEPDGALRQIEGGQLARVKTTNAEAAGIPPPECEQHRIEVEFDGFPPSVGLVHPESGCPRGEEGEDCFLTDWLENEGVELLRGKLTLPVRWEVPEDRDHPLFHVLAPNRQPTDTASQPDGPSVADQLSDELKRRAEDAERRRKTRTDDYERGAARGEYRAYAEAARLADKTPEPEEGESDE